MKFKLLMFFGISITIMLNGNDIYYADTILNSNIANIESIKDIQLSYGRVSKINNNSILLKDVRGTDVLYNFDADTIFIDSKDGSKIDIKNINEGDRAYFYHSPITSLDMPYKIYAVVVNIPMDTSVIKYHIVEYIENTENGINIGVSDSDLKLKLDNNAVVSYFDSDKKADISHINLGTRFFTWYQSGYDINGKPVENADIINNVIIVPFSDCDINIYTDKGFISDKGRIINNDVYVPLRAITNAYDINIEWNPKTSTAIINDGTRKMNFTVGNSTYVSSPSKENMLGVARPLDMDISPFIDENGVMWIPAYSFEAMIGYDVEIDGGGNFVSIAKIKK